MQTLSRDLELALGYQQSGRLEDAKSIYQEIVLAEPNHHDAWHYLGTVLHQQGLSQIAIEMIRQSIAINCDNPFAYYNLGLALNAVERFQDAVSSFQSALAIKPDFFQAYYDLGLALNGIGKRDAAVLAYRTAIDVNPDFAPPYNNLGAILIGYRQLNEAEIYLRQALALKPDFSEAHRNLGTVLLNRGQFAEAETRLRAAITLNPSFQEAHVDLATILIQKKKMEEAEAALQAVISIELEKTKPNLAALFPDCAVTHYYLAQCLQTKRNYVCAEASLRRAITISPDFVGAYIELGNVLMEQRRFYQAEESLRQALKLKQNSSIACNKLGKCLAIQGRLVEAEGFLRQAIGLDPDNAEAYCNLGSLLMDRGQLKQGELYLCRALELSQYESNSDCKNQMIFKFVVKSTEYNLGLLLLSLGRYSEGWFHHEARTHYEARPLRDQFYREDANPNFPFRRWKGDALSGKSLVLYPEQGYGDQIQLARYIPLLKKMGASNISLITYGPLKPLLETVEGVDDVITSIEQVRSHDYWEFLFSLPYIFHTEVESIPTELPYLSALPEREEFWRSRLPSGTLRVGLAWKGSPAHRNDDNRSLPDLFVLAPLWEVPGITFVFLQKGQGESDARACVDNQPGINLGPEIEDLADTAAIVALLDLVICVDTALAHVAGALNKPCWVLLPAIATDWRWMCNRTDSPWYPCIMRLFRQTHPGRWETVVEEVRQALAAWPSSLDDQNQNWTVE